MVEERSGHLRVGVFVKGVRIDKVWKQNFKLNENVLSLDSHPKQRSHAVYDAIKEEEIFQVVKEKSCPIVFW